MSENSSLERDPVPGGGQVVGNRAINDLNRRVTRE